MINMVRRKVLLVDLALFATALLAGFGAEQTFSESLFFVPFPVVMGILWFYLARLKCSSCKRTLSRDFPVGGLALLPFGRQDCKSCGSAL